MQAPGLTSGQLPRMPTPPSSQSPEGAQGLAVADSRGRVYLLAKLAEQGAVSLSGLCRRPLWLQRKLPGTGSIQAPGVARLARGSFRGWWLLREVERKQASERGRWRRGETQRTRAPAKFTAHRAELDFCARPWRSWAASICQSSCFTTRSASLLPHVVGLYFKQM